VLKTNPVRGAKPLARQIRCEHASLPRLAPYMTSLRRAIVAGSIVGLVTVAILWLTDAAANATAIDNVSKHTLAPHSMPPFITAPGARDWLLVCMAFVLVGAVLAAGVFFFWLHSLPERLVHNSTKVHFDIVAALGLLSLFTHVHLFWVAALLLALVRMPQWSLPDFSGLLGRIAASVERMSGGERSKTGASLPRVDNLSPGSKDLTDA
jgi:hypothetical protein